MLIILFQLNAIGQKIVQETLNIIKEDETSDNFVEINTIVQRIVYTRLCCTQILSYEYSTGLALPTHKL